MKNTAVSQAPPKADVEYAAAIDRCIQETQQLRELMAEDQKEIERLRAIKRARITRMQTA